MGEILSSSLLAGASDIISALGGDARDIARRAGVPSAALSDPAVPVLGYAMTDFFEIAAHDCRCGHFGMLMAEQSSLAVIGPVWSLLDTAATIGQMIDDLTDNFAVYSEAALLTLSRSDGGVLLTFEARAGHCESEVQMVEFALAITVRELRRHCPPDWQPATILFRHAVPADLPRRRRAFGPNLMFEQDRNGIFLDLATLAMPRHPVPGRMRQIAEHRLHELNSHRVPSAAAQVEQVLKSCANLNDLSVAQVGELLGLTERTLQRQLATEGVSLRSIKDTARMDLALKYVRQSHLPLGQIAELLGYSELSAFTRAFRRWHGCTATSLRHDRVLQPTAH
jgi:AraC-like DNA-binding protein